jgi:hypothetical protein
VKAAENYPLPPRLIPWPSALVLFFFRGGGDGNRGEKLVKVAETYPLPPTFFFKEKINKK